jgi:hypothetical protein
MFNWILGKYYARLRRMDMEILWPICLKEAKDLDHAKGAFYWHAMHDPAWLILGEEAIVAFIDKLEAYD